MIKVILCDDHALIRRGIRDTLSDAPDIEVIDRPDQIAAGHDPSVEKAVDLLLTELGPNPRARVVAPPAPSDFGAPTKP